jgi:hypothetical protein
MVFNARTETSTFNADKPLIIFNVAAEPPSFGGHGDLLHRRRILIFRFKYQTEDGVPYPFEEVQVCFNIPMGRRIYDAAHIPAKVLMRSSLTIFSNEIEIT